jgi:hypothetical protein
MRRSFDTTKSEAEIQREVREDLEAFESAGLITFARIGLGGVLRRTSTGRRVITKNDDMRGMPDFLVWFPKGRILHLEIKTPTGSLSKDQIDFQARVENLGHEYAVATSREEASLVIETLLLL